MAFDKRKTLQTALAYTQQGRWDRAINEYQAILKADPSDLSVYNMLGDIYARIGNKDEAISYYLKLGELYRADGLSVKAIAVYKKIIKLDPTNIPSYLACGDLYAEQGLVVEARIQYLTAADSFGKEGLTKQALGVYQKLADLDPSNLTIRVKLAEMLLKEGLQKEAVDEFLKVATGCMQIGQLPEAEKFFKRVLQIQADSKEACIGLGQLYYRLNDFPNAVEHLGRYAFEPGQVDDKLMITLAESHKKNHQLEKAEGVLVRILRGNPQHRDAKLFLGRLRLAMGNIADGYLLLEEIAEGYLRENEVGPGLDLLKEVKKADPSFLKVRRRLADLYHKIGNETEAQQENKEIADIFFQRNEWEEARNAYRAILQAQPDHEEVRSRIEEIEAHFKEPEPEPSVLPEVPPFPQAEALSVEEVSEGLPDLAQLEPEQEVISTDLSLADSLSEELKPTPPAEAKEEVENVLGKEVQDHLIEAEIYLKYDIIDKAVEHLKSILEVFPRSVQAHQRLKGIYLDEKNWEAAIEESLVLADIFEKQEKMSEAIAEIEIILGLDPDHAVAKSKLQEMTIKVSPPEGDEAPAPALEQLPPSEPMGEERISLETPLEIVTALGEIEGAEAEAAAVVGQEPIQEEELPEGFESFLESLEEEKEEEPGQPILVETKPESPVGVEEDLAEADFYLQHEMLEEARTVYRRILEADPSNQTAQERLSQLESEAVSMEETTKPETSFWEVTGEEALEISEPEKVSGEVSLVAPTAFEAAIQTPAEEVTSHEELPTEISSSSEVQLSKEVTPVFTVAPPTPTTTDDGFVDFAAELEKELEKDAEAQQKALEELAGSEVTPPTLSEILQEFQKGVRKSLEEKDFDTHYDLGIAYKDMDLLEEAIEEFKLASKDPSLALNSSQLIGLCYMKMGDVNSAIEEFLKGLSIPNQLPEQYRGLKYELALAYEAAENLKNALDLFSDIFQEDPNFREVGAKLKRLSMPRSQSSEKGKEGQVAEEGPESREEKKPTEEKAPPSPKPRQRKIDYI